MTESLGIRHHAAALAARFRQVWPDRPAPVGWSRVLEIPAGVEVADPARTVAACAMWRVGTERVVALGAEHGACAIGRYTQGFADGLPEGDATIGAMVQVEYIDPAEVPALPHFALGPVAALYGPLDQLPVEPAAALVLATPEQAMILSEALGLARAGAGGMRVMGRPTCAAIPAAVDRETATGSLGCTGARLYAGFDPAELLVVIPAAEFAELAGRLDHAVAANAAVAELGRANLAKAAAG